MEQQLSLRELAVREPDKFLKDYAVKAVLPYVKDSHLVCQKTIEEFHGEIGQNKIYKILDDRDNKGLPIFKMVEQSKRTKNKSKPVTKKQKIQAIANFLQRQPAKIVNSWLEFVGEVAPPLHNVEEYVAK